MSRWTIRTRLTVIFGALFVVAGAVLLSLTYLLVQHSLDARGDNVSVQNEPVVPAPTATAPSGQAATAPPNQAAAPPNQAAVPPNQAAGGSGQASLPPPTWMVGGERQLREQFRDDTLHSLLTQGSLALGGVAVLAVGFGWVTADRVLRPLHRITETARRVADRSLHERIALAGPRDEIKELADTFDSMLERLDHSFEGQRRFVANASHELRTPLAINHTLLEVALRRPDAPPQLRDLAHNLLAVNARHERLIDGLLTLAHSEQPLAAHDPVDLAEVVRHAVTQAAPQAAQAQVTVRTSAGSALTTGDAVLLDRVVENLLRNAIRYNTPGGWVSVATEARDAAARLVVVNTGPPVPAYAVPGLFEPFRRLRDRVSAVDGSGSGLGLSIVRSVTRAHGGAVTATPREGGGLTVTVALPLAHPPASTGPAATAGPIADPGCGTTKTKAGPRDPGDRPSPA